MTTTTTITPGQALDSVAQLLTAVPSSVIEANNPLINLQLASLLGSLNIAKKQAGLLSIPVVIDISNMSTGDLIDTLMTQTRQTNNLVATSTLLQAKNQQQQIIANNQDMLKKLQDASSAAQKAEKLKKGLGIFKWVMLALSVLLTIISTVATVLTFGGAAPAMVAAGVILAASIALTIASSVPVNDAGNSALDIGTQKLSEAIAARAKADLIAQHPEWSSLSDSAQAALCSDAQNAGTYGAMATMITIQIIIAVVMVIATAGAASGTAGSYTVNAAEQASQSAVSAALSAAKQAIIDNLDTITALTKTISYTTQVTRDMAQIANSGVQMYAAKTGEEAALDQADATFLKSYAQYLSTNNTALISVVQELYDDIHNSYTVVTQILQDQHKASVQMSQVNAIA